MLLIGRDTPSNEPMVLRKLKLKTFDNYMYFDGDEKRIPALDIIEIEMKLHGKFTLDYNFVTDPALHQLQRIDFLLISGSDEQQVQDLIYSNYSKNPFLNEIQYSISKTYHQSYTVDSYTVHDTQEQLPILLDSYDRVFENERVIIEVDEYSETQIEMIFTERYSDEYAEISSLFTVYMDIHQSFVSDSVFEQRKIEIEPINLNAYDRVTELTQDEYLVNGNKSFVLERDIVTGELSLFLYDGNELFVNKSAILYNPSVDMERSIIFLLKDTMCYETPIDALLYMEFNDVTSVYEAYQVTDIIESKLNYQEFKELFTSAQTNGYLQKQEFTKDYKIYSQNEIELKSYNNPFFSGIDNYVKFFSSLKNTVTIVPEMSYDDLFGRIITEFTVKQETLTDLSAVLVDFVSLSNERINQVSKISPQIYNNGIQNYTASNVSYNLESVSYALNGVMYGDIVNHYVKLSSNEIGNILKYQSNAITYIDDKERVDFNSGFLYQKFYSRQQVQSIEYIDDKERVDFNSGFLYQKFYNKLQTHTVTYIDDKERVDFNSGFLYQKFYSRQQVQSIEYIDDKERVDFNSGFLYQKFFSRQQVQSASYIDDEKTSYSIISTLEPISVLKFSIPQSFEFVNEPYSQTLLSSFVNDSFNSIESIKIKFEALYGFVRVQTPISVSAKTAKDNIQRILLNQTSNNNNSTQDLRFITNKYITIDTSFGPITIESINAEKAINFYARSDENASLETKYIDDKKSLSTSNYGDTSSISTKEILEFLLTKKCFVYENKGVKIVLSETNSENKFVKTSMEDIVSSKYAAIIKDVYEITGNTSFTILERESTTGYQNPKCYLDIFSEDQKSNNQFYGIRNIFRKKNDSFTNFELVTNIEENAATFDSDFINRMINDGYVKSLSEIMTFNLKQLSKIESSKESSIITKQSSPIFYEPLEHPQEIEKLEPTHDEIINIQEIKPGVDVKTHVRWYKDLYYFRPFISRDIGLKFSDTNNSKSVLLKLKKSPKSKTIKTVFEDSYHGKTLDFVFNHNVRYSTQKPKSEKILPPKVIDFIFSNERATKTFIRKFFRDPRLLVDIKMNFGSIKTVWRVQTPIYVRIDDSKITQYISWTKNTVSRKIRDLALEVMMSRSDFVLKPKPVVIKNEIRSKPLYVTEFFNRWSKFAPLYAVHRNNNQTHLSPFKRNVIEAWHNSSLGTTKKRTDHKEYLNINGNMNRRNQYRFSEFNWNYVVLYNNYREPKISGVYRKWSTYLDGVTALSNSLASAIDWVQEKRVDYENRGISVDAYIDSINMLSKDIGKDKDSTRLSNFINSIVLSTFNLGATPKSIGFYREKTISISNVKINTKQREQSTKIDRTIEAVEYNGFRLLPLQEVPIGDSNYKSIYEFPSNISLPVSMKIADPVVVGTLKKYEVNVYNELVKKGIKPETLHVTFGDVITGLEEQSVEEKKKNMYVTDTGYKMELVQDPDIVDDYGEYVGEGLKYVNIPIKVYTMNIKTDLMFEYNINVKLSRNYSLERDGDIIVDHKPDGIIEETLENRFIRYVKEGWISFDDYDGYITYDEVTGDISVHEDMIRNIKILSDANRFATLDEIKLTLNNSLRTIMLARTENGN